MLLTAHALPQYSRRFHVVADVRFTRRYSQSQIRPHQYIAARPAHQTSRVICVVHSSSDDLRPPGSRSPTTPEKNLQHRSGRGRDRQHCANPQTATRCITRGIVARGPTELPRHVSALAAPRGRRQSWKAHQPTRFDVQSPAQHRNQRPGRPPFQ